MELKQMTDIRECFSEMQSLSSWISEQQVVDEGLRDLIAKIKQKFKDCVDYLRNLVARISGSYWCPVDDAGNVLPAISPLTAGQAYVDGAINTASTLVCMDRAGARATKCKTNPADAKKLYGSGNSIAYWKRMLKESNERFEDLKNLITEDKLEETLKDCPELCYILTDNLKNINEVKMHTEDPEAKYNVVDTPALKARIKMAFKNKKLARLMIWGAPGIGKTAILMSVLQELPGGSDYNLVVKTLSNETPDNFTLPKYIEMNGQQKATDVPKTWLPVYKPTTDDAENQRLDDACGKGLLFIDELSRATPQVLNVILPLINEGIFNGYKLGSGWVIIVASNRMEDEMSGQSELGNALSNRFAQLYYEPTVNSWKKWAETQNYMSPLLLQWLGMPEHENMSGGKFFYMDPNEDMEGAGVTKLMCTPRSWTNAMRELAEYSETGSLEGFTLFDIPREILAMTLNQYVPAQAVDSFLAFLEVISKIGNFDQAVRDIWKNGGKSVKISKKDLGLVAIPLMQLIATSHAKKLPDAKEFENLAQFVVDQNSDQLASYLFDIYMNVYVDMLPERVRPLIFVVTKKTKTMTASQRALYEASFKPFCDKWGISFDQIPDYSAGHTLLAKKYAEAFKAATIDGTEFLG